MVILALAERLNVVASSKVMPSGELDEVCTTSLRKISSRTRTGEEFLSRSTVAMPVTVATLPIGSTAAGCASVAGAGEAHGGGEGAGDGCASGCACASSIASNPNATLAPAGGDASSTSANMKRRQATVR